MRYARVRHRGVPTYGVVRGDNIHPVQGTPFTSTHETGDAVSMADIELLVPTVPSKIMCVGRNYAAHIAEMGYERPERPSLFMKPLETLVPAGGIVDLPPRGTSQHVQHEAELAVVIGSRLREASGNEAVTGIAGYTIANDVSARDVQRADPTVIRGKGFDTFCPLGPWIETNVDPSDGLRVRCWVNDKLRQDGTTSDLVFDVAHLVSWLSHFTTLQPGDVVLTGSPGGSGDLVAGDHVRIEIEGIGVLSHDVRAHHGDRIHD